MATEFPHDPWTSGSVWLDALEQSSTSPATLTAYRADITAFLAWSKAQGLASPLKARTETVSSFLAAMASDGRGSSSMRRAQSAIRSYFRYWIATGPACFDPTRNVPRVATPDTPTRLLTAPQVALLLDGAHRRAREAKPGSMKAASLARTAAMLETLYSCGFQVSDLCALPADFSDRASGAHRLRGADGNDHLLRALRLPCDDALPAALAMIANGYLSINIAWGLDLDLPIKLGPAVSFGESNFDWRSE